MIVLIVGPDQARSETRAKVLKGKPARELLFGDEASPTSLISLAQSESLFGEIHTYGIVGAFEGDEEISSLKEVLPALQQSEHLFLIEEETGADLAKAIEKVKGEVIKVKAPATEASFNTFALANALAARDRKKLWLYYMEAKKTDASAEMLVGMLAWKARSMLAQEKKGRVPTGWKAGESERLSSDLVSLYHDSRRGVGSLDLLLEKFILTL